MQLSVWRVFLLVRKICLRSYRVVHPFEWTRLQAVSPSCTLSAARRIPLLYQDVTTGVTRSVARPLERHF